MNELKKQILDLCNNSKLPLEAIIYVVKDIWRDAEDTLRQVMDATTAKEKEEGDKKK